MNTEMERILRLVLILVLVLTGIGLGAARGTIQSGGQIVLCTGEGVVIRHVPDAPGQGLAHICPDMALSLLNATTPDTAIIPLPDMARRAVPAIPSMTGRSATQPPATARDPPVTMFVL